MYHPKKKSSISICKVHVHSFSQISYFIGGRNTQNFLNEFSKILKCFLNTMRRKRSKQKKNLYIIKMKNFIQHFQHRSFDKIKTTEIHAIVAKSIYSIHSYRFFFLNPSCCWMEHFKIQKKAAEQK